MNKTGLHFENLNLEEYDIIEISMLMKIIVVRVNAFALLIIFWPLK